ncbi:MAG: PAS domain S-box protein [Desulfomonilaceae bacterium]
MKARVIEEWWQERLGDALIFYKNVTFSEAVQRYFKSPDNAEAVKQVQVWLETVQTQHRYKGVLLLDSNGNNRLTVSESPTQVSSFLKRRSLETMQSGQVESTDFYRDDVDGSTYLAYLVPIVDPDDTKHSIATLVLWIDPQQFIYPFIKYWPTESKTAETILVRRNGDEVVYLNELRFRKNIPLERRVSITETQYLTVKAVLGREGITHGIDYRGNEVVAYVCQIAGTPWYLASRMDKSEFDAPLKKQLWLMIFLVSSLICGSGAFLGWLWNRQNASFYCEKFESSQALEEMTLFNQEIVQGVRQGIVVFDNELRIILWNPYLEEKTGIKAADVTEKNALEVFPHLKEQGIDELLARAVKGEIITTPEHPYLIPQTGKSGWVVASYSNHLNAKGEIVGVIASVMDVTEIRLAQERLKLNEARLQSLYEISQYKFEDNQDLLNFTMEQAVRLTGSKFGHIRQYDEITQVFTLIGYSKDVFNECKVNNYKRNRELGKTGLWGEAVRQRKAIVVNDYKAPNPFKKGQPDGHIDLVRYVAVPVFYDDKIVAVVGVANKESDYGDTDVMQLSLLMEAAWRIMESNAAREQERKLITAVEQSADSIVITDSTGTIIYVNPAVEKITGYSKRELIGQNPRILKSGEHDQSFYKALWDTITNGKTWSGRFVNRSGPKV